MTPEAKSELTAIIAEIISVRLPEDAGDYPTRISLRVLLIIEQHNERLRQLVCRLIDLRDS